MSTKGKNTVARPAREMDRFRTSLNSLFNDFFEGDMNRLRETSWQPAMDVELKNDEIIVSVELPGVKEEDINLTIEKGYLNLTGKRERRFEQENEKQFFSERRFGSFQRSVRLPRDIDADRVEANLSDGILEIRIPGKEKEEPRKIKVEGK
jgi:HSP20 family protein